MDTCVETSTSKTAGAHDVLSSSEVALVLRLCDGGIIRISRTVVETLVDLGSDSRKRSRKGNESGCKHGCYKRMWPCLMMIIVPKKRVGNDTVGGMVGMRIERKREEQSRKTVN